MENNILKEKFSLYKLIRYAGGLACVIAFQSALFPLLILYKISNSKHLKMTESLPVFLTTVLGVVFLTLAPALDVLVSFFFNTVEH